MARSRTLDGPYELHPDTHILSARASAGRRIAARRPRRSGRDAARRDLHGLSLRPAAAQPRPLHAGPRNGDPEDGLGRRRLAADLGRSRDFRRWKRPRRRCPSTSFPRRRRAKISTARNCRSTSNGCARPGRKRSSASPRGPAICGSMAARRIGSLFRQSLVARRQQAHCFSARDRRRFRAGAFPAERGPRLLLQQRASSITSTSRTTKRSASICA